MRCAALPAQKITDQCAARRRICALVAHVPHIGQRRHAATRCKAQPGAAGLQVFASANRRTLPVVQGPRGAYVVLVTVGNEQKWLIGIGLPVPGDKAHGVCAVRRLLLLLLVLLSLRSLSVCFSLLRRIYRTHF